MSVAEYVCSCWTTDGTVHVRNIWVVIALMTVTMNDCKLSVIKVSTTILEKQSEALN